jgi:hypothetical protein
MYKVPFFKLYPKHFVVFKELTLIFGKLMNNLSFFFQSAGYPSIFSTGTRYPAGYPASQIHCPAGYRI